MDLSEKRDNMLHRMAMATPGGPMFRHDGLRMPIRTVAPADFPKMELADKVPVDDMNLDKFDEAQSFATGRKGLIAHTALMRLLGGWAIQIRRELDAGRTVVLSVEGREIARIEP